MSKKVEPSCYELLINSACSTLPVPVLVYGLLNSEYKMNIFSISSFVANKKINLLFIRVSK